jgi:hypothetical protein
MYIYSFVQFAEFMEKFVQSEDEVPASVADIVASIM